MTDPKPTPEQIEAMRDEARTCLDGFDVWPSDRTQLVDVIAYSLARAALMGFDLSRKEA